MKCVGCHEDINLNEGVYCHECGTPHCKDCIYWFDVDGMDIALCEKHFDIYLDKDCEDICVKGGASE